MFTSYAQNFEDVILWRAFRDKPPGFYIDIGACDPVIDSVSLAFYKRGWRGVHVEPVAAYAERLRAARPDEIVIEAAVSDAAGPVELTEFPDTGLTTGIRRHAQTHVAAGWEGRLINAPTVRLSHLFDLAKAKPVDWLKIDVEGMEDAVLRSWGDAAIRPRIIVIESMKPNAPEPDHARWESELTSRGYACAYFDGLNRFYVAATDGALAETLAAGPNFFDDFTLTRHSTFARGVNARLIASEAAENAARRRTDEAADAIRTQAQQLADAVRAAADAVRAELSPRLDGLLRENAALQQRIGAAETQLSMARALADSRKEKLTLARSAHATETALRYAADRSAADAIRQAEAFDALIKAQDVLIDDTNYLLAALEADLERHRTALSEIRRSSSWRLTQPVRLVGFFFSSLRLGPKGFARAFAEKFLTFVRRRPALKAPLLSALSLAPPLKRKVNQFRRSRRTPPVVALAPRRDTRAVEAAPPLRSQRAAAICDLLRTRAPTAELKS